MHMYCKNCKKHTGNTFPKKISPHFKEQNQRKIKMCYFLTVRTFIYEIEDKYGLESELDIYPQFFTD